MRNAGSVTSCVKGGLDLFCKPFSYRNPDLVPFLGVVFPSPGIQDLRLSSREELSVVSAYNPRLTGWLCKVVVSCQSNLPSRAGNLWSTEYRFLTSCT